MTDRLRMIVYACNESVKPVFERIVDFDSNTSVPFERLCLDARFLFGSKCKVVFEL